jgi:hypothetical protein
MSKEYDYCIIGAGPTGLTLAYLFSKIGKKCLLIDKNQDVGGCHRVTRVNGLFTEHGPRIYSSSYKNTRNLLKQMDINFDSLYTPYKFTISDIGKYSIKDFNINEIKSFIYHFLIMVVIPTHGKNTSMKNFMETNMFSEKTKDYIDRLCRLTDGASSENYSVNKFLQLFNQQFIYTIYQPSKPNDEGLFKLWLEKLYENNVDFMMNTQVLTLDGTDNKNVDYITVVNNNKIYKIKSKRFIMCIPPKPIENILNKSILYKDSFGELSKFQKWVNNSTYMNYIPITFHWNKELELQKVWGFPKTEWGIAFIVLTNYMNFNDECSKLVISTCVTKTDTVSSFTNKTANQSNEDELKKEVVRQLKISFPELPEPSNSILHPGTIKYENKWIEADTAYIETYNSKPLPAFSSTTQNLYQVGTQNGNSIYSFTTMESAITNAIVFSNILEPKTQNIIKRKRNIELIGYIRIISFIIIFLIIYKIYKIFSKKL